jgi:NADH:ubiquinone oxidoreductase subunit 6 (subunit J)
MFYLVATPIMLFEAWRTELLALSIYLVTCSVVMTMLAPVFAKLARRTTRHIHADTSVQEGLRELLDIMKTYQRRYLQFNLIMVLFCFVYSIVLGIAFPGSDVADNHGDNLPPPVWVFLLIFIIILILLMLSTWYIAKWWIHLFYGRYIRDLEVELRDVEAIE